MSTAVYETTSVHWHATVRAGMADVEQWDRSGYASGDVELGMQDAGLSSAQHYDVCRSPHKLYSLAGRVGEERKSAFVSVCNKRKVKANAAPSAVASLLSTEILKDCSSKWIHFLAGLPSIYIGPQAGSCICSKLVSDSLKLDILVTKASPHFPRLRSWVHYLFLAPSLSVFQGLQLHHPLYTRRQDVHNADLFVRSR